MDSRIASVLDEIKPDGDKGFTIKLKEPFSLMLDALGKVSSLALFVMPERLANTDPFQQVTEMVGSGPFKFVKDGFEPGHKVVYVKNPITCRARSRRAGLRAARSSSSTASNGSTFPMR